MVHIQRTERLNLPLYWPLVNNMSMAMLNEVVSLKNPFNLCMDKLKIMLSVKVNLDSYQLDINPLIVLVQSQIWQIPFLSQSTASSEFTVPLSLLSFSYQVGIWSNIVLLPWQHQGFCHPLTSPLQPQITTMNCFLPGPMHQSLFSFPSWLKSKTYLIFHCGSSEVLQTQLIAKSHEEWTKLKVPIQQIVVLWVVPCEHKLHGY